MAMLALAGCGSSNNVTTHRSPSPSAEATESPSPWPSPSPSPSASPLPTASPVAVPSWAAMHATCSGGPAAQEALITLQGASHPVLADVTDPVHLRTMCAITGPWTPRLVTQGQVSWYAWQNGTSLIATLDLFAGTSAVVASWTGGGFMDGLHAWSPDHTTLAYVTSDANGVNVHVLSGGGDRVLASFGAVPGRGVNPNEDDEFIGFSPDGGYFAFEQTFTSSGNRLVVWSPSGIVFSQPSAK